jgi:hypothetical protein
MATVVDKPAAPPSEQPPAGGAPPSPESKPPEGSGRTCRNCGSPLKDDQDWCLQCGAAVPGALGATSPGWRAAAVLGATVLLALAAAATAYAAWGTGGATHKTVLEVAQTPAPPASTPLTHTPPPIPPKTAKPPAAKIPVTPATPPAAVTPPKITANGALPKSSATTTSSSSAGTSKKTTTSPKPTRTSTSSGEESQPTSITLDTNAAATYNPYGYPASEFGDPSLAIDGDPSTAWTAKVKPALAPKMAVGLVIDLKTAQKISSLYLLTSTPGLTVQVYGANGNAAPPSITDSSWTKLSPSQVVSGRQTTIKLADSTKAFRFVTLWISRAPASSGHVSANELELFPAG